MSPEQNNKKVEGKDLKSQFQRNYQPDFKHYKKKLQKFNQVVITAPQTTLKKLFKLLKAVHGFELPDKF